MSDTTITNEEIATEKPSRFIRMAQLLLTGLLCAGFGWAGYWGWQLVHQAQIQLDQNQYDIQQLRRQLEDQVAPLTDLSDQMTAMRKSFEAVQISQRLLEEQQQDTHAKVDDLTQRLDQFTTTEKTDWLLAEIEGLLKLADQHLALTYDVLGAVRLLDRAAQISESINEVGALELRQAILNDRHQLAGVGQVDIEGIFLELGALANQVPKLGIPARLTASTQTAAVVHSSSVQQSSTPKHSFDRLSTMWTQLMTLFSEHLVRVRKVDQPIQPLLPPDQRVYLDQNLILLLEQAQLAVLRQEARDYGLSLQQAQAWIRNYFDAGQPATQNMLSTLQRLQNVNVHPLLPQLNNSMNALQSFERAWSDTKKQRQLQSERLRINQAKPAGKSA